MWRERAEMVFWLTAVGIWVLALLMLVAGCSQAPAAGTPDRRAIERAAAAWTANPVLPQFDDCLDHIDVVKRHTKSGAFKKACANPFSKTHDARVLTGCTDWGFSSIPWRDVYYEIHIAPKNEHEQQTIRHETLHILIMCTDLHQNGDALHTDKRIWKSGGPKSAEVKAGD